jgi:hypothetical protein
METNSERDALPASASLSQCATSSGPIPASDQSRSEAPMETIGARRV